MAVGIACPECRYLIGVANENIRVVIPVTEGAAGAGYLNINTECPNCKISIPAGRAVDVILPEMVEGGKRRVNVRES